MLNELIILVIFYAGVVAGILRPIAGWIGDKPYINRLYLVGGSAVFCGIVAGVSISFHTYPLMIVYALLAGIGGGKQVQIIYLKPIILVCLWQL